MEEEDINKIANEELSSALQLYCTISSPPAKSLLDIRDNLLESELAGGDISQDKEESNPIQSQLNESNFEGNTTAFSAVPYNCQPITNAQNKLLQNKLSKEFWEALQNNPLEQDALNLISEFGQICNEALNLIRSSEDLQLTTTELQHDELWQEIVSERQIWCLISALYHDRLVVASNYEAMDDQDDSKLRSEKEVADNLYRKDKDVREVQVVIDWLEFNAKERLRMEPLTDIGVGLENTLHQLKHENIPYPSCGEIVESLDPDAPVREGRPLHDFDKENDDRLIKQMFANIRSGCLDEAQSLAVQAKQFWRPATLEGWRLYHDPNYNQPIGPSGKRELLPIEGNHHRDIWKKVAYRLCNDLNHSALDRACYGPYCGHLKTLLEVASSWEDHLWSYLKVFVDVRVEREIRQTITKSYAEMPQEYWDFRLTVNDIFQEIADCEKENISLEDKSYQRTMQRYIIFDRVDKLMEMIKDLFHEIDEDEERILSPHFVRFSAHLILFFRKIGRIECEDVANLVIENYVIILKEMKQYTLVAYYISQLPPANQVPFYAAFLLGIYDPDERSACLKSAVSAGLDINEITKTIAELMRQQTSNELEGDLGEQLSVLDIKKMSALDWLLFYPTQRPELLIQGTALIADFLLTGKTDTARMVLNKIPIDSINLTVCLFGVDEEAVEDTFLNRVFKNVPKHIQRAIKDYLCYKAYLDAEESFSDWSQHFHSDIPQRPELKPDATSSERNSFEHDNEQCNTEYHKWWLAMENQTEKTKTLLLDVLKFPEGWLVDEEDSGDSERNAQLNNLRSIIIPKVSFMVQSVLYSMELYAECVSLCDLIADPNRQLFKVFTKPQLSDFMTKVAECSVCLMNEKKDPWGYSLP